MKIPEQVNDLQELVADYAGLIFYPLSARCVDFNNTELRKNMLALSIKKIGVFVNETPEQVIDISRAFGIQMVQLHGHESVDTCRQIRASFPLIKAFRINATDDVDQMVAQYMESADYFLFDTGNNDHYGGTGKKFDWHLLKNAHIGKPFFLSGGIGPGDVEALKKFTHPFLFGIDINSRFEIAPGEKNIKSLSLFINAIKAKAGGNHYKSEL
ncbi:MAG: phosphoribosylanthranilate isomerase [Flavisolibacter sp.]|nr:phosphoribosylanthranilate isomerase [Flavisolibacter sp.]